MPFKSEKQRRFLWAEHPDIAKRWAHEYPDSNKNLPMYAAKKPDEKADHPQPKEKAATVNIPVLVRQYVNNRTISSVNSIRKTDSGVNKTADSKQEIVDIPHSSEPVYAGEEREKGKMTGEIPDGKNISGTDNSGCEKPKNAINELLTKLSVVLSPHIEQTMENLKAEREGRVAVRIPRNRGIKRYPCATPSIPLPMGMAQAQQPQQQTQPQRHQPVGGGSNPQFNPINAFGAISMTGVINGNAAFGAKNSPDSSKLSCVIKQATRSEILGKIMSIDASDEDVAYWEEELADELAGYRKAAKDNKTTPCSCGCGDTITTCKCASSCSCKQPGGSCYKPAKEKDADMVKYSLADTLKLARCWAGYEPVPGKAPYSEDSCRPVGSGKKKKKENKKSEKKAGKKDERDADDADADTDSKAEKLTSGPSLLAAGLTGAAGGLAGFGASKYLESKGYSLSKLLQKKAGTPAWQRSEGKNEAGGLNEKGRKSYEREHGGNLKAPVTESNPKGERAKRQNSFCSRMCGMKRVNTGSKTKSDPDSRINKSLRKWNCKCSSAMEFGLAVAGAEKQANPLALAARAAKPGWAAVQAALKASRGAASAGAKVMRRPPPPVPVPFSMTAGAKAVEKSKIMDLVAKHMGQIGSQADEAVQAVHGGLRNAGGAAQYVANHTSQGLRSIGDMAARAGINPESFSDVSKFFTQSGSRIKELITNAIGAQRMAEGTLKVPAVPFLPK